MITTACVCGSGTMGTGIAIAFGLKKIPTILFDTNPDNLEKARDYIKKYIDKQNVKFGDSKQNFDFILDNISFTPDINRCKAELIIEAIVENESVKTDLYKKLEAINDDSSIIASNTSSLSISALQESLSRPENFAGLHFFNPAQIMKLVEVIKGNKTSDKVITILKETCEIINKQPVICIDSPGFIVNRVARPYYLEAMSLVEKGLCRTDEVDKVLESAGFKMGPFKLMDLIGLDINYNVSCLVWEQLGKPDRLKPSKLQQEKVNKGELGIKTKKGFYQY